MRYYYHSSACSTRGSPITKTGCFSCKVTTVLLQTTFWLRLHKKLILSAFCDLFLSITTQSLQSQGLEQSTGKSKALPAGSAPSSSQRSGRMPALLLTLPQNDLSISSSIFYPHSWARPSDTWAPPIKQLIPNSEEAIRPSILFLLIRVRSYRHRLGRVI